jgi:hypothetical protein
MWTMDISLGGAALLHEDFCETSLLALDFTPAGLSLLQLTLRVLRGGRIGTKYYSAGEFIGAPLCCSHPAK